MLLLLDTDPEGMGLKLPPIKNFGRHRSYVSFRGWGRRGDGLKSDFQLTATGWHTYMNFSLNCKFNSVLSFVLVEEQKLVVDVMHPTLRFAERLRLTGYDERRMDKFMKQKQ
jgi:hypothetical protein